MEDIFHPENLDADIEEDNIKIEDPHFESQVVVTNVQRRGRGQPDQTQNGYNRLRVNPEDPREEANVVTRLPAGHGRTINNQFVP